jgi:predicted metal-dependent hydrolase
MIKTVEIEGIGTVKLAKRKGTRSIRISVDGSTIRVGLPTWLPYEAGIAYALKQRDWIEKHKTSAKAEATHAMHVGKAHQLRFVPSATPTVKTRIKGQEILIEHPVHLSSDTPQVQSKAIAAAERALKKEAQALLPQRLAYLAKTNNLSYSSVDCKKLKTRWGSCSSTKHITLNYFLMQLPWELIDYVLVHELTHTLHMNHSADFWHELTTRLPNAKSLKKTLKDFRPELQAT